VNALIAESAPDMLVGSKVANVIANLHEQATITTLHVQLGQLDKRAELFVGADDETPFVAVRIDNPDGSL
jgi:hypothetical protein